jgi:hypothetical protein
MSSEDMADIVRHLATNHRELGGFDNDIVIDIAGDGSDGSDGSNSSDDGNGDDDGGTVSPGVTQDRDGKQDRRNKRCEEARKVTDNGVDTDGSDDVWQLATDSDADHPARLLARQEELGLGRDDLILLGAREANSATAALGRHQRLNKRPRRSKRSPPWSHTALAKYDFTKGYRASNGPYPSAEAVADAFEQLEVTGWTSSRRELELELSDSELESTLKASWQKDRQRKRDRKRAREELRAQGLLEKNANPNDPRVKYPNGMSLDDLKSEFRAFLLGSEHRYIFKAFAFFLHEISWLTSDAQFHTGSYGCTCTQDCSRDSLSL